MREFGGEVDQMAAVRYEKQERVGHIILDRPPANSYDKGFLDDLSGAIDEARFDAECTAIVVRTWPLAAVSVLELID